MAKVAQTITGEGQATDKIQCGLEGLTLMIGDNDNFDGTISVQYTSDDLNWEWVDDERTFTNSGVYTIRGSTEIFARAGCKVGDYTRGSITVILYRTPIID